MTRARSVRPDPAWIRARRTLLRQVKSEVVARLGLEPEDVARFRRRYERELSRPWKISSKSRLMARIEQSQIIYGGDFHALAQSQRTHLRILRSLETDRPVVLALECFARSTQKWLDLYLAGKLSLDELRQRAKWGRAWGFPWEHYRPLFELAKKRGFRLLALNEAPGSRHHSSLLKREERAAAVLRRVHMADPQALLYVIFGDLHLAESHLPAMVKSGLKSKARLRDLIIHMNSEKVYFELARRELELSGEIVEFAPDRFCILSSPPWVQWQSYLLFLEHESESASGRGVEDDEFATDADDFDPTDQVADLVRLACGDLAIDLRVDDLAVYSAEDRSVWSALDKGLTADERLVARRLLASGRSFYLPRTGRAFLARLTVNHAAGLAGEFIHAKLSKRRRPLWKMPSDFKAQIWTEAVAYFISKLVNHKRRSESLADLRAQLAMSGQAEQGREAMKLAMDHLLSELIWLKQARRRPSRLRARRKTSYIEAARILGGIMGERLFLALRSRKLNEGDVVDLLKLEVAGPRFQANYEMILRKLGEARAESLDRRERL